MHHPNGGRRPHASARPPTKIVNPSYRELRRKHALAEGATPLESGPPDRRNIWLRIAAPAPVSSSTSLAYHERQRRAELTAYALLAALLISFALLPVGLNHPVILAAAGLLAVGALFAGALNRAGATRAAAWTLIAASSAAVLAGAVLSPRLDATLDFLAVPVLLSGLLLMRRAPLAVAAGNVLASGLIVAARLSVAGVAPTVAGLSAGHALLQPAALMLLVALVSWMGARSLERALQRADRAAEVAAMRHALAGQQDQLEHEIQALLATLAQAVNGDIAIRADTSQQRLLRQITAPLNKVLGRLAGAVAASERLRMTEEDLDRLTSLIAHTPAGWDISWPSPTGTRVDRLVSALTTQAGHAGDPGPRQRDHEQTSGQDESSAAPGPSPSRWSVPSPTTHRQPHEIPPSAFGASFPPPQAVPVPAERTSPTWATHPLPALPPLAPSFLRATPTVPWAPPPVDRPSTTQAYPEAFPGTSDVRGTARRDTEKPALVWDPTRIDTAEHPTAEPPTAVEEMPEGAAKPVAASPTIVHVVPADGDWPDWPEFLKSLVAATPPPGSANPPDGGDVPGEEP